MDVAICGVDLFVDSDILCCTEHISIQYTSLNLKKLKSCPVHTDH